MRAAIDVLAALPAPRWLVLGDMGEVGDQGPAFHREVGAYAQRARHRVAVGGGRGEREHGRRRSPARAHFADVEALIAALGAGAAGGVGARQGLALHAAWSGSSPRSPASRGSAAHRRSQSNDRRRMLLSLAQWLQTISPEFGFMRVFQYITFRAVMAAMTALV